MNKSLWIQDLNPAKTELTALEPQDEKLLEMWLSLCVSSSVHVTWVPGCQGCYLQTYYISDA